ncbi:MAG TPA: GAF domain-containing protein, partial [Candidatus Ozemobacteraceae bacterium]|nr:GAF domain-containing protein [Candidatus Ozemobacteraceae bacterium]
MTDTTIPTTPLPEPASRISLQARVFLAMSLLLLATLCGTSWVETERARESYERDIRSHVNGIWKSLDELVRPLLIERNVPLLTTIALKLTDRETADNPLQGMAFLSRDMITLAHSHPASAPVDLESRRASDIIQFLRPIRPPERTEPLGYLRLEYSTMPLGQKQDEILRAHLWLFVFLLFFAWMLAGVVARALKAPLRSLEETANQLSSGRLDARVPGQPQEDLGSLVDSFNRMADSIGAHLKDLDQKNVSLERRVFELSTLQQAGRIINSVLNLDRLYEVIVDTTIQVLGGVKRCSLMLADRPSNEFVIKIAKGLDVGNLPDNRRVPITDGVAGKVFQTGEPILINDLAEGEKTLMLDPARISRSSICVPIKVNDDVIGIISAGNKMTGERFTANDLALLETLATQAGIAMKNAKLYFDLDRKIIELGTLHEVGKSLSMVL